MTFQRALERIRMEGLTYGVSKGKLVITVLVDDHRADFLVDEQTALIKGSPMCHTFDYMVEHMRELRNRSLSVQTAPPGTIQSR
jgi:hypothetical protein